MWLTDATNVRPHDCRDCLCIESKQKILISQISYSITHRMRLTCNKEKKKNMMSSTIYTYTHTHAHT